MTIAEKTTVLIGAVPSGILMENISWELYTRLREETDNSGQHIRMTYDEGRLELMSPLPIHEGIKRIVGRIIDEFTMEMNIPIRSLGSTTWKREDLAKGLEADECYFIQHESQVRGRQSWDLHKDPAPDLAVEVDITYHPLSRQKIYAALGVREVWQYDGKRLAFLNLNDEGKYEPIEASVALPALRSVDLNRFIAMYGTTDETSIIRSFREWVRQSHG